MLYLGFDFFFKSKEMIGPAGRLLFRACHLIFFCVFFSKMLVYKMLIKYSTSLLVTALLYSATVAIMQFFNCFKEATMSLVLNKMLRQPTLLKTDNKH